MYIIAIAWIYVTLLMALTEANITAAVLTFVFYGLLPCALLIWIIGTPQRRRNQARKSSANNSSQVAEQPLGDPDRTDAKPD